MIKKLLIFTGILVLIYSAICIYNVFHFESYENPQNIDTCYLNKEDMRNVFETNEQIFRNIIAFFERNYDEIELNYSFDPPQIILNERSLEYIKDTFGETDESIEVEKNLKYIFEILRFTDFVIREDKTYYFIQRSSGETSIGVKYDGNNKNSALSNWSYYYKRGEYQGFKYIGKWLYDLIYNNTSPILSGM